MTRKTLYHGLVVFLGFSTLAFGAQKSIAPASWYLKLSAKVVSEVKTNFKIDVREGIYYENQRVVWNREDVNQKSLNDPISFEDKALGEGQAHIGLAKNNVNNKGELWLIKPGQEKFLLASFDKSSNKWVDRRFIATPKNWTAIRGGVLVVDQADNLQFFANASRTNTMKLKFKAYLDPTGKPVMYYSTNYDRMLIAVKDGGAIKVEAIDLTAMTSKNVRKSVSWPFSLQNHGVWYLKKKDLYVFRVNLAYYADDRLFLKDKNGNARKEQLRYRMRYDSGNNPRDSYKFIEEDVVITRPNAQGRKFKYVVTADGEFKRYSPERSRFRRTRPQDRELMRGFEHNELIKELSLGSKNPVYGLKSADKFMADVMGAQKNNWAILLYDKGQMPEELVANFAWQVKTGGIPASRDLRDLDALWQVQADVLFDEQDPALIFEYMRNLHDVVRKRKSIMYMRDLPSILPSEAGSRGPMILQAFWKTFRPCYEKGTCRVVMTMRRDVYSALKQAGVDDILSYASKYVIPKLSKGQRTQVSKYAVRQFERKRNRHLKPDAFKFVMDFASDLGRSQESPGNELAIIDDVFTYIDTHHKEATVIDRQLARAWIDYVRGISDIRKNIDIEGLRKFLKKKVVGHDFAIDAICNSLKPVINGTHFGAKPLSFTTLIGTPGIGKTYIAKLVAEYLTGKNSLLLVDMKTFSGFPKDHPVRTSIESSKNQFRVVLFDDVDQVGASQLDYLAGVVEEGVYAQGTANELRFSNTIVLWTANWGEKITRDRTSSNQSIRQKLRRALTEGDKPVMKRRIWSRIERFVYALRPFTEKQLLELAFVYTDDHNEKLKQVKDVEIKIDPRIFLQVIAFEEDAQAGARSIINQLHSKVFVHYQDALGDISVKKIGLLQVNDDIEVFTDRDEDFKDAWDEIVRIEKEVRKKFKIDKDNDSVPFNEFKRGLMRAAGMNLALVH